MPKPKHKLTKNYRKMISTLTFLFFITIGVFFGFLLLIAYFLNRNGISLTEKNLPLLWSLVAYGFCFLISSAIAYLLTWAIFKPLQDIQNATQKIAEGDYSARLRYNGKIEELAETIENFNHMAEELDSVEMMRNDFIANVSHEFKTPLSALNGYVTLLQDDSLSPEERDEYVRKAFFSIEKLNDLTDNILRLSKLEHQTTFAQPECYRLDEQIREAIVLLEPKWNDRNIDFELDLPKISFTGQRSLLFQVWTNLISNAIKFSHRNGVITVRLAETEQYLKISIIDEGIGMDEQTLKHIFDKFYQADSSRQLQGNGLGLALCKEILSRCNGTIQVISKLNEGSAFTVKLKK